MRRLGAVVAVGLVGLVTLGASPAGAVPAGYTVLDLGTPPLEGAPAGVECEAEPVPPPCQVVVVGEAINDRGDVIAHGGPAVSTLHGTYLHTRGRWESLPYGGFGASINNRGQVVVTERFGGAVLYDRGKEVRLPLTTATDLNDRGEVAGRSGAGVAATWRAGRLRELPVGGGPSEALALNDRGQVVGVRGAARLGFLWDRGRLVDLGTFVPAAVNDRGTIAGMRDGQPHLWSGGRATPLATGGHDVFRIAAINLRGDVLGESRRGLVLWRDGTPHLLTAPDGGPTTGGGLNDRGQVVGGAGGSALLWEPPARRAVHLVRSTLVANRG